jgi:dihydroflavonol-4-reductase
MNIAITGANGHVGINLCSSLQEMGHYVRALNHKNDFGLKHINVDSFKGDLLNQDSLRSFLVDIDVVVHLAAKISIKGDTDGSVQKINIDGTRNILEASRQIGVKKFIHFSSIHAFQQEPLNEVLDERRKAEGERIVLAAVMDGYDAIVLCPSAIIGPVDYEPSLIGTAMLELYNHLIPALVPGGYNWVDVRDVVNGCISAIWNGRKGEKYLLSGQWRSLKDVTTLITRYTGMKTTSTIMPFWVAHVGLPFITLFSKIYGGEPLYTKESLQIIKNGNRNISNAKARKELDFSPRTLEDTIRDLFIWFRENGTIQ